MKHLIIGAGPAGVIAAETLRKVDPSSDVTIVGDEPEAPYSRMAIPYVLTGNIDEAGTHLRKEKNYFKDHGIEVVQGRVKAIKGGAATLEDGKKLAYDRLLVATGSRAATPKVPGMDLPGVTHCWTMADMRTIADKAAKGSDVVLMGAGFIGCIILEALALRGVNLTVIEAEDRMLPKIMDAESGNMVKAWVEAKGVKVLTATRISEVKEAGKGKLCVCTDAHGDIEADLVVVAAGVKSNMEFLEGSGVDLGWGVKTNNRLETSVKGIFAAGDVAEGPDFSGGNLMVHPIQPTAVEHGRIAALNMADKDASYKGSLIMNTLDTLGLVSCSFGHLNGDKDVAVMSDPENFRYTKLVFDGDVIKSALTLGRTDHIGVLRGLIQSEVRLGVWKERLKRNPNLLAEAYVANTVS